MADSLAEQSRSNLVKSCHLSVHARSSTHYRSAVGVERRRQACVWISLKDGGTTKRMEAKGFWSKLVTRLLARETLYRHIQFAREMNERWASRLHPDSRVLRVERGTHSIHHACKCEKIQKNITNIHQTNGWMRANGRRILRSVLSRKASRSL